MQYWITLGVSSAKSHKILIVKNVLLPPFKMLIKTKFHLLSVNERGGFVFPSCDVFKIISLCEINTSEVRYKKCIYHLKSKTF